MKQILLITILISGIAFSNSNELRSQKSDKVLLYIRDGSGDLNYTLLHEVDVMIQILTKNGYNVMISTLSGEPLLTDSSNVTPDIKLSDVKIRDYAGLLIPCMHAGPSYDKINQQAIKIIKEGIKEGIPIAAQHASIMIFAKAGVLQGRKYAYHSEVDTIDLPDFKGSKYSGKGVVRDGHIISSGVCPYLKKLFGFEDCTSQLTNTLITAIRENKKQEL